MGILSEAIKDYTRKENAWDRCSLSYLHPVHFEVVEVMAHLPGCPTTLGQPMRLMSGIGPYLL
jgi:hypothetical protein